MERSGPTDNPFQEGGLGVWNGRSSRI
jgi:hypothetical protein